MIDMSNYREIANLLLIPGQHGLSVESISLEDVQLMEEKFVGPLSICILTARQRLLKTLSE